MMRNGYRDGRWRPGGHGPRSRAPSAQPASLDSSAAKLRLGPRANRTLGPPGKTEGGRSVREKPRDRWNVPPRPRQDLAGNRSGHGLPHLRIGEADGPKAGAPMEVDAKPEVPGLLMREGAGALSPRTRVAAEMSDPGFMFVTITLYNSQPTGIS